jgi:restriction system protein
MTRAHHSAIDDDVAFIMIILVAGTVWAHKAFMTKAIHYLLVAWLIGLVVFLVLVVYKVIGKVSQWRYKQGASLAEIDNTTGQDFESYVAKLMNSQGYGAIRLTEEYDYGVDIIAVKDGITWGIQVKRYSGLVKADAVRQVVTALKKYHCDRAMVITNSYYSEVAKELARVNDCVLIDRNKIKG